MADDPVHLNVAEKLIWILGLRDDEDLVGRVASGLAAAEDVIAKAILTPGGRRSLAAAMVDGFCLECGAPSAREGADAGCPRCISRHVMEA